MGKYLEISRRVKAEMQKQQTVEPEGKQYELNEVNERSPAPIADLHGEHYELNELHEISPRAPTLNSSNSFLSYSDLRSGELLVEIPVDLDGALERLVDLHREHAARLNGRGIARVLLADWREAIGIDEFRFWSVMKQLEESGQIIREHGHARPKEERQ